VTFQPCWHHAPLGRNLPKHSRKIALLFVTSGTSTNTSQIYLNRLIFLSYNAWVDEYKLRTLLQYRSCMQCRSVIGTKCSQHVAISLDKYQFSIKLHVYSWHVLTCFASNLMKKTQFHVDTKFLYLLCCISYFYLFSFLFVGLWSSIVKEKEKSEDLEFKQFH